MTLLHNVEYARVLGLCDVRTSWQEPTFDGRSPLARSRPHDIPKVLGGISTRGFYNLLNSDRIKCPRFARIGKRSAVLFMDELIAYREVLRRRDEELAPGVR